MSELILTVLAIAGLQADSAALRRLAAERDSLEQTYQAALRAAGDQHPLDTLATDGLVVVVPARFRRAFGAALGEVAPAWLSLFEQVPPVLTIATRGSFVEGDLTLVGSRAAGAPTFGFSRLGYRLEVTPAAARRMLWTVLAGYLDTEADSALLRWTPGVLPRLELVPDGDVAYQLATAPGASSAACRRGNRAQCAVALGLEGPLAAKELPRGTRAALLAWALEAGGAGAWSRLVAHPDEPIALRLAAAARRPDGAAVVADWLDAVGAARSGAEFAGTGGWVAGTGWLLIASLAVAGLRRRP